MLTDVAYLTWIRAAYAHATWSLASSGVPPPPADALSAVDLDLVSVLSASPPAGPARLAAAISTRYGVPEACVVPAPGATGANFLVMAALLSPGDEVIVETPRYAPMADTAAALGARVVSWPRRAEDGWQPDPDALGALVTERTGLLVLTDPHNPSGVSIERGRLDAIVARAARLGVHVLVDEVYRDLGAGSLGTAFAPEGPVLVTSSLTKAYGLSSVRAGWALAPAALAPRLHRALDHVAPSGIEPGWSWAARFLETRADAVLALARARLAAAAERLDGFLGANAGWKAVRPDAPCIAFLEPPAALRDVDRLADDLLREAGVLVVPGRFFGDPGRVRVGLAAPLEHVEHGLGALAARAL